MIRYSTAALLALATTLTVQAGTEMTSDHKDMKQMSQSSYASDAGFYVAAFGGVNFSTSYGDKHTSFGPLGANNPDSIHSDVGGVGGIKAGYNFESFPLCNGLRLQPAVEAEAMYIGMRSKTNSNLPGIGAPYQAVTDFNNGAGFINGIARFKLTDGGWFSRVTPYIGLGVGAEYLTTHTHFTLPGANVTGLGTDDLDFAAQALAGFDYNLNKHWTLFTEYKFIDVLGSDFNESLTGTGLPFRFAPNQITQNIATVGVKYNF